MTEVIARNPLATSGNKVRPGVVIESIDGHKIAAGTDYYPLLAGKAGKKVTLGVVTPEGRREEQVVKPIGSGQLNDLLYNRWVERNRQATARISGGRIGYIHVKGMDSPSFRTVYSDLLGRYRDCDAVVIDTRHNGGGWLHDDLATLLSGKQYAEFAPRGQYIGSDPFNKWLKRFVCSCARTTIPTPMASHGSTRLSASENLSERLFPVR